MGDITALRKTGPRLALLEAVADGRVWRGDHHYLAYADIRTKQGEYATRRVTASIDVMERAGLVTPPSMAMYQARWARRPYALTAEGEALLAEWSKP